jgi:hypothetical protein
MAKPFPAEFRRDVVAVARKHEALECLRPTRASAVSPCRRPSPESDPSMCPWASLALLISTTAQGFHFGRAYPRRLVTFGIRDVSSPRSRPRPRWACMKAWALPGTNPHSAPRPAAFSECACHSNRSQCRRWKHARRGSESLARPTPACGGDGCHCRPSSC